MLPTLTVIDLPEGVVALDLADEEVWRVIGLLSRSGTVPSPAASAFCAFVLDQVPKLLRTLGLEASRSLHDPSERCCRIRRPPGLSL